MNDFTEQYTQTQQSRFKSKFPGVHWKSSEESVTNSLKAIFPGIPIKRKFRHPKAGNLLSTEPDVFLTEIREPKLGLFTVACEVKNKDVRYMEAKLYTDMAIQLARRIKTLSLSPDVKWKLQNWLFMDLRGMAFGIDLLESVHRIKNGIYNAGVIGEKYKYDRIFFILDDKIVAMH